MGLRICIAGVRFPGWLFHAGLCVIPEDSLFLLGYMHCLEWVVG
jgi:hypothetical protein